MAGKNDTKKGDAKGAASAPKKGILKLYKSYTAGKSNLLSCPKCGQGTFMAKHKNRGSCGKCRYTEFVKKEEKPTGA